jgi:hypothetical protein
MWEMAWARTSSSCGLKEVLSVRTEVLISVYIDLDGCCGVAEERKEGQGRKTMQSSVSYKD